MTEPLSYFGLIEIDGIQNSEETADIALLTVEVVHYPDCQQLVLWLPEPGRNGYGTYQISNISIERIVEQGKVEDKLNGAIQLLFDTLPWPPGDYTLHIEHPMRGLHQLKFHKLEEGKKGLEPEPQAIHTAPSESSLWTVYRDGLGNPIPNEDQLMRERSFGSLDNTFDDLAKQFLRRVEYSGTARAGNVTYVDPATRITFWYEMGGGPCKLFIDVPLPQAWEATTRTPLARRDEILDFVARSVQREQAPSWRFEIEERAIVFY